MSDAGTPGVSDPGFVLVRACVDAGVPVEVLPGPTAPVTALVASALPADRWRFVGFLPRRKGELRRELERTDETLVAFESPNRLPATLALLAEIDAGAAGRGLPRVDEAARGGRARQRRGGGAAVRWRHAR